MSDGINTKQVTEKVINEDSSTVSNSTNTSFTENILQEINSLKSREIYLISKSFETKIPELLSYLQSDSNSTSNKLLILKYLENLFSKVNFNSEIFSSKYSNEKERLNLFQIIINQFINCTNEKEDYIRELKDLFILLLSQITLDKETYHYIFSFLINYINKCNNNSFLNENQENIGNLNSEQLSRILQLLQIYYQSMQTIDEPYNYLYFNGDSENFISITNRKKNDKEILNLDDSLNILIFMKLLPSQIIKQVYPIIKYKILDIKFNDKNKMISIGIDKDNYLTTNFTSEKLLQLKENKIFSILIKLSLKESIKTDIFINNEKVDIPKKIIIEEDKNINSKEKLEIKELKFFRNFIGICSNIIIYKEEKDKKNEGLPKFFLAQQKGIKRESKEKFILKTIYLNGFYKEELFSVLLKQELKDKIDEKMIKELNMPIKDKSGENDIKDFLEKNLISIYMPNRIILPENQSNKSYKSANQILLKDSINNLDAEFIINSPNLNGAHIHKKFSEDFSPFGGLNHFLPIIELMTQNEELLSNENLSNFFNLILSVFMPSYLTALKNENNSNFFFNLSYFLEKIHESYFDNQIACKLISLSSFLISLYKNYFNLIKQFYNYILMNETILFKFGFDEQAIILKQITYFIDYSQIEKFNIDIMLIINILLHYDKNKYNKFCCKKHADYFNEPCEVHSPEINILLKPVEEIIVKLFEKFVKEASTCINKESEIGPELFKIFQMLTIDISPCLQKIIINQFFNYLKKHYGKYFGLLDKDRQMLDIIFFIFKTSIFDVKLDALNLIFFMNKIKENMDEFYSNRSRTNSWAFKNETNVIDEEKSILIENYILPFYLLGEGIIVSSSSSNVSKNDEININNIENNDIDKNDDSKSMKRSQTEKNIIQISKNTKKINKSKFSRYNEDYNKTIVENKNFSISENGREYTYINIKITTTQQKIYLNYKKKKMKELIQALYTYIFKSLKEKIGFELFLNLLLKIVSKGDIILINQFLDEFKKKSESKDRTEEIYNDPHFFHWLLETSFQIYMMKNANFDEKKFMPGFCIDPIDENSKDKRHIYTNEERKIKIEEIYKKTNEFISNIIKNNIYKLDYIFTWSKYYYEMRNDKNNYECVRNYVLLLLRNSYKLPYEISLSEKKISIFYKDNIYFLNLLFEFLTFYKFNGAQNDNIKEENQIDEELSRNFPHILFYEINNNENKLTDNDIIKTINIKWKDFPFYEKIYSFFKPLWIALLDKKKKEEKDKDKDNIQIFKKHLKKDSFINELELLFYSFNDIREFKDSLLSRNYANKGIKSIYMIFHFFILLFNVGGNEIDIKNLYNDFRLFMTLLLVSSTTVTVTTDTKKKKWPNESQNREVQDTISLILHYTLFFFITKITEIDISIKKNNEKAKDDSINKLNKYYNYVRQVLIENLGYLLKILYSIYKENYGKSFLKKFSNSENITNSASYKFSEKLYNSIDGKDSNNNDNNNENFLDNIWKLNIKRDSKEINSEFEKNIYSFINSSKIKNDLSKYINDPKNKSKLYPFGKYIQKREKLIKNIIPSYDNRTNSHQPQKHLSLAPDYYIECHYDKIVDVKVGKINKQLITEIFLNQKKVRFEENEKINEYKKIKKKLFSFKGIWSKEEFFYEQKYHLKFKLVNHLTEDYSRILLTPILDIDYYLPSFTYGNHQNIFRNPEKQIPIYYLTDLSFALDEPNKSFLKKISQEEKINNNDKQNNKKETKVKEDNINQNLQIKNISNDNNSKIIKKSQKTGKKRLNILYDVKTVNYSFYNSKDSNEPILTDSFFFSEFITLKHSLNSKKNNIKVDACLVKTEIHICGIFYNNAEEIGFYSSKKTHLNEDEDYDFDRKVCFGSIFKSQQKKYHYYYLKIPYNSIEFILKRRYYFKKTVLEIFTINKKSYSFRFEENDMKKVYENIRHYMKSDIEDISIEYTKYEEKIGFYNKNRQLPNKIQIPNTIKNMNLKYLYDKWSKWEISTLKLLMLLNIYANRSYNDINQYPVFPWIITDYISEDFPQGLPIRPFGVPMGMLDFTEEAKERKESYISTWELNKNEVEKEDDYDRYRSHYSNSLYITYYLVRTFPFSSMRIELQGKNFDDPNRLFNSINNSFYCALTQKSDLRELIPELFFFPELFYNLNKLNLGVIKNRETGEETPVNDISIPKWAKNDGYIFISKHRMFLESPEISEKINEWFNIIFGYKQNGSYAKKIGNLFIRQTYENFYEIFNKSEPKDKVYFCRMVEFGVTPSQIFKNDAYKRINYNEIKTKKNIFSNITEIIKKKEEKNLEISKEINVNEDTKICNKCINHPVKIFLDVKSEEDGEKRKICILNEEGSIKIFRNDLQQNTPVALRKILSSKNLDFDFNEDKIHIDKKISKKIQKTGSECEINLFLPRYRIDNKKSPSLFFDKGNCIALGGFWNGNILIEKLSTQVLKDKAEKNDYPETKIYSTKEYSPIIRMTIDENEIFVICGNILGTIFVYTINQNDKTDWNLYKIIFDHNQPITSISINEVLNIFITCSKTGYCMVYTLPNCKLVNSYKLKNIINNNNSNNNENTILIADISLISSSPLPCIIFYFKARSSLAVFSINGHFINEKIINFEINSNEIKIFADSQFNDYLLIFNKKNENIEVYNIIELKMIMTWPIKKYSFIDFILSKDLDSIFALVNYKIPIEEQEDDNDNDYKILVLKNTNVIKQIDLD